MRDYSKVSSSFWTGETGRAIRGDRDAQIVALYLMTSPHANMIGVFHCPVLYIAHETGSPFEGALKGLRRLIEGGFCTYDEASETVWVHEMARFQIGDELKASDNRVKDIHKQFSELRAGQIRRGFHARYKDAFHLPDIDFSDDLDKPLRSPFEAPSKPLRSQKQEQEQEQEQEIGTPEQVGGASPVPECTKPVNGSAISLSSFLDRCKAHGERPIGDYRPVWEYAERVGIPEDAIVLAWQEFSRRYGPSGGRASKRYRDWRRAFRNAVEENWMGLWTLDEQGRAVLTTRGRMAEKVAA